MSVRLPATSGPSQGPRNKLQPQQSTVWTRKMNAVCVRRARKTYGRKSNQHVILDNLNMTVPKGCIYGLLGASGCGKTTLLSCIVGRRTLNSGEIWVLGGKPGTRGSGVPGPRVGYMPQDMALYGEFTIQETMLYFGWVNGMTTEEIEERSAFLFNLLQLPGPNRYVKELSGGQQRRVSMAATFLHQPELLILDEPTVGVDPLIRQSVWDHLVEITREKTTTIIITTHYIDETKQATTIGLMRGGRFLAEDSPDEILRRYNTDSLEDAFLKLSILQNRGKRRRSSISSEVIAARAAAMPELESAANEAFDNQSEISGEFGDNMSIINVPAVIKPDNADPLPPDDEVDFSWKDIFYLMQSHHMKALIWKNILWIWRNLPMMLFIFGIPVSQISFFCWSIGHDPVGLKLAVVNHEVPFKTSCMYNTSCSYESMSCRYLKHLSDWNHTMVSYSSPEEAMYAVKRNWAWAYIDIPPNFSEMLALRVEYGKDANDTIIDGSQVSIHLDMSNQQIAYLLQRQIMASLNNFAKDMAAACSVPESMLDVPMRMHEPIYGPAIPNFTDFAAPGVMLTIVFFIAVSLTSGTMMIERDEGILERCLVSGITGLEILSAHVVTQFFVMLCQAIVTTVTALYIFNISNEGDLLWITLMMVLSGVCGMTYGFVLSSICDDLRNATYLSVGSFLPFIMLCGIIWPVQGMSKILQMVSYFLPLTLSTESLRSILARGWDINHPIVYSGFIALGVWTVIFMIISVLLIKFKKG
ncbi:ABC transporter G family member 23 isoform X1 [Halyomorpha halys]|uniref:ABC transporter G family member 23 isoform X1 n=2 Tax=Halyomorpha halys TaxID=286706 RepID=UPI0006D5152F|nr:ABC transporter G family member 23-like isoform X1 [Halyomorpha halys]XP_014281519.1 ABC transporter G family member 23-like isoform X1 [Halyomorpha halys]